VAPGAPHVTLQPLTEHEKAIYEWQMWTPGFDEQSQTKLKNASVMVSRCGGLGGVVCYQLAAAGIGRLILAHGGVVKPSDLNRQLLMTHDWLGKPRIQSITRRLLELNPRLQIVGVDQNVNDDNAQQLVAQADVVVDAAPLFNERYLMNRHAVAQGKPMVECAMYELTGSIFSIRPGHSPCLRCVVPETPPYWKRQFPVFGAVSGTVGCIAAMEVIKIITGLGEPLFGRMLCYDLRDMAFRTYRLFTDPSCPDCPARAAAGAPAATPGATPVEPPQTPPGGTASAGG
jgi:molybdopterin-synthase adenylyltransferase